MLSRKAVLYFDCSVKHKSKHFLQMTNAAIPQLS